MSNADVKPIMLADSKTIAASITDAVQQPQPPDEIKTRARTEVQAHGFLWEQEILQNVYRATQEELATISYTSNVDLPAKFNRLNRADLSIKTSGNNKTICMGNPLRVFDETGGETPLHLVVICFQQYELQCEKKITSIIEIDLTNSRELLFGSLTRAQLEELDRTVKEVPQKRRPTADEHKKMFDMQEMLQKSSGAIYLNIKCDSAASRLQCSFNRFQSFIKNNETRVIAHSDTNNFRGGSISAAISSSQRKFKSKDEKTPPLVPRLRRPRK